MNTTCPRCGIAHNCDFCPNCGTPATPSFNQNSTDNNHHKKIKLIWLIPIIIIAFVSGYIVRDQINFPNNSDQKYSQTLMTKAESISKDTVTPLLNKPDNLIAFNKYVKSDNFILSVNKIGMKKEIIENDYMGYKSDSGKFAIINITIKNVGKELISLDSGYFKLVAKNGAEYSPSFLLGLSNKYIDFESMNPGISTTGNLVFEVPSNFKLSNAILKFSGTGLFTEDTNFSLE